MSVTFYPGRYVEPERGAVFELIDGCEDWEINVSNANAYRVLDALGLSCDELTGECVAQDFLGRVLVALAIAPEDIELPAYRLQPSEQTGILGVLGSGGVQVWQGPRRRGYLQERLRQLAELAEYCAQHDYFVLWA